MEKWDYFAKHIGSYTICLLISHLSEASLIIEQIESSPLMRLVDEDAELKQAYDKVVVYLRGDKKRLLNCCMQFRNNMIFHYNETGKALLKSIKRAVNEKGLTLGRVQNMAGAMIYDTAEVALNEYFELTFFELYEEQDLSNLMQLLKKDTDNMCLDFRLFSLKLVSRYLKQFEAEPSIDTR